MTPRIAIIGAGPGGLSLACILQRNSIIPSIFERDSSADYRPQGGTLDLDVDSGQQALHDAGLWDQFLKYARYDAQIMKFLTKSGDVVRQVEPDTDKDTRPEIDRVALRNILIDSFGNDRIHWGYELISVEPTQRGLYDLHFKNGKLEAGFDLVVGADGAHSRVRPRITSIESFYSGVSIIEVDISSPRGSRYDAVNELVGNGSAFAFGDQKSIQAQRLGDGTLRIYVCFAMEGVDPNWLKNKFDASDPAATKSNAAPYFKDWKPAIQDCLLLADEDRVEFRPLYMHPVDETWDFFPGLTLIGDAAHLMTPYAGEGVNIAMRDSLELAKKIIEGTKLGDLNQAIREYEIDMFKRGSESKGRTNKNKKWFFAKEFPNSAERTEAEL
jgi:2-polyprenyl-6-methoxyphenol hydroxylase-like FAD-dependent oxidoreductase